MKRLRYFWLDENGAAAIEYGLIVAGIAVAIIMAVLPLGAKLVAIFGSVRNGLN